MPICPKCHLEISAEHYERHLARCGHHHKRGPMPLYSTSGGPMGATPYAPDMVPPIAYPWWKYGLVVFPPKRLTRQQKWLSLLWFLLVTGGATAAMLLVLSLLGVV